MSELKVFVIDEELYAATSAAHAAELHVEQTGEQPDYEPREMTEEELDAPQPEFDENVAPTGGSTTVRQMLAEHGDEPGWLAGPIY